MHADNISKQFQEKDMPLYKTMLDKISKSAVKKHQNIQDWIRKHLPYDELNSCFRSLLSKSRNPFSISSIASSDASF